jgi:hypothetical protein
VIVSALVTDDCLAALGKASWELICNGKVWRNTSENFTTFKIALVVMHFDDVASLIINANHSIMRSKRLKKKARRRLSRCRKIAASLAFLAFEPDEREGLHQLSP